MVGLRQLLEEMVKAGASDLHLTVGSPPVIRVDGKLSQMPYDPLTPEITKKLAYSIMSEKQRLKFENNSELDLSFGIENLSRFRGNVFVQRGNVAVALRRIPYEVMTFEELELPKVIADLAKLQRGLILVTGPTGSGKSTTLAAIIDKINRERQCHIITVEDPIEYLHRHQQSIINQREVHSDTNSFASALKYALREDPDVVLVGEMRDLETIESALTISETGHLVFATLHTNSTSESINRIIDVFPTNQQDQVRVSLSFCLQAIVSQCLLPKIPRGRVLALEIMTVTPAIRALIRDDKVHQIYSMIQSGQKYGMKTMNQSLAEHYISGKISINDAMSYSSNIQELNEMLTGAKSPAVV
ncbi:MAG: type IV pili twitching motility protein PilT [Candidatus Zixiibacteriota bacterium]|nr:MAG: type IV pili twitching motility protein PilT [candidate division Zixibacteria bacterium]HHI03002.1 type IV pilus twitching motility protein PilT [candidate division Zixibacteria bacterium]